MEENRQILADGFRADVAIDLSDDVINLLLDAAEPIIVPKRTYIIREGEYDSNMYITANGVTRISYFDGIKEVTLGFGGEASVFVSPLGYVRRQPSNFSLITVTDCDMLKVRKADLDELLRESHELALWMFNLAMAQMDNLEFKLRDAQRTAKERYRDFLHRKDIEQFAAMNMRHVDIAKIVPDKVVASYLGVIPSHLSNIKKEIIDDERQKPKE